MEVARMSLSNSSSVVTGARARPLAAQYACASVKVPLSPSRKKCSPCTCCIRDTGGQAAVIFFKWWSLYRSYISFLTRTVHIIAGVCLGVWTRAVRSPVLWNRVVAGAGVRHSPIPAGGGAGGVQLPGGPTTVHNRYCYKHIALKLRTVPQRKKAQHPLILFITYRS